MTHALTSIRQAAVELLQTQFQRVYPQRTATAQTEMPCVFVYVDGRRTETVAMSPIMYQHSVNLAVVVCVQSIRQDDDLINQMLGELEQLFFGKKDLGLPDLIKSVTPTTLQIEQDDTGEVNTLYYQQNFRIVYFQETD